MQLTEANEKERRRTCTMKQKFAPERRPVEKEDFQERQSFASSDKYFSERGPRGVDEQNVCNHSGNRDMGTTAPEIEGIRETSQSLSQSRIRLHPN